MLLTKATTRNLTLPDGKREVTFWDDEIKGFGLRLRAGGASRWIVQFRNAQGQQRKMTLTQIPISSVDQARAAAERITRNVADERDPQAEKVAQRKAREAERFTIADLAKLYLDDARKRLRPSSFDEVKRHIDVIWAPLHGQPAGAVDHRRIAQELAKVSQQRGLITANRARSSLSAMMAWAVGAGRIDANPVVNVGKPLKKEPRRERVLSDAELAEVWKLAGDDDFGRVIKLLILTAARREEVASLRWSELDLGRGEWLLPAERAKNGRAHLVPLSAPAVEILRSVKRRDDRDLLFGEGVGGFSGWSRSKARLDAAVAKARAQQSGVPGVAAMAMPAWTIHDLRRSAATGMARLGISIAVIERALNHVSGEFKGIVAVYQRHDFREEVREALEAWARHVETLVRSKAPVDDAP